MIKKSLIVILNEVFLKVFGTPIYHPRFWQDERDKQRFVHSFGFWNKLRTLLAGFNSDKYVLYNFAKNDHKLYLNDIRRRILVERVSKKHFYIVHNKIVFNKYFENICNVVPKLALINNGHFLSISAKNSLSSTGEMVEYIKSGHTVFLKPHDGGSGRGIKKVSYNLELGCFVVNDTQIAEIDFISTVNSLKGYIVENQFKQEGFSSDFYPKTLNTLRICTMVDPETGLPFVAIALHRMGSSQSVYADNWSQGGLSAWIDVESGVMGRAIQYPFNGVMEEYSVHPVTNVKIAGAVFPNWQKVKDTVLECASNLYFMPLIGWDVIVSNGEVYILEANYNPDVNLIQVHQPLLANERIRKFYKYHKVIP